MAYESVNALQTVLEKTVFSHTKDSKKAAGRALGTLVEIIAYYLLKTWGFNHQLSIERGLEEYGNSRIAHDVEFSLHSVVRQHVVKVAKDNNSITAHVIKKAIKNENNFDISLYVNKFINSLLTKSGVLRNACTINKTEKYSLVCSIKENKLNNDIIELHVYEQVNKPYAIFECKRVGMENKPTKEGQPAKEPQKGPQTIEKAKQGAYVARTASSLQKIRNDSGELYGIIYKNDNSYVLKPYVELMDEIIDSNDNELLKKFILTVGVVSNHGNWVKKNEVGSFDFSEDNFRKELLVLGQSYDWLLFLTDSGLTEFVTKMLIEPTLEFEPVRKAFLAQYSPVKKSKGFTKTEMNIDADRILLDFFSDNLARIEEWFEVISPSVKDITMLKEELQKLNSKDWEGIVS